MQNNRIPLIIGAAVVGIVGLGVVWWLASPLFINRTVDEEFPAGEVEIEVPEVVIEDGSLVSPTQEEIEQMSDEERAATEAAVQEAAEDMPDQNVEEDMMEEEPVVVARGEFQGASPRYQGSGTATIYRLADGSHVLRLENFNVTNGPDLHVYLSGVSQPATQADVMASPSIDLGPLKGNQGNQNYEIPIDFDVENVQSVTIYCVPFHVLFSFAPLS